VRRIFQNDCGPDGVARKILEPTSKPAEGYELMVIGHNVYITTASIVS
jgi:hypothetical protein